MTLIIVGRDDRGGNLIGVNVLMVKVAIMNVWVACHGFGGGLVFSSICLLSDFVGLIIEWGFFRMCCDCC